MTTQSHLLEVSLDRALYLGPRQLQLMRVFWAHGALTVSELLERLAADPPLAYTTLMSMCVRLYEKGLLDRRKRTEESNRLGIAYIYTSTLSEAEYTRRTIGRSLQQYFSRPDADNANLNQELSLTQELAELGMLPLVDEQQAIASLLERAELAEQAAAQAVVKLRQAEERIAALHRRAQEAERPTDIALRRVENLERQLNKPPKPEHPTCTPLGIIVEHHDPSGICRVCAQPAPPASARRLDDLRVCVHQACRKEARRRDNNLKQRRYNERRSART
jgi:predicted transcriptional regulator